MSGISFLGIVAPYPRPEIRQNGWYKRIYLVDKIFDGVPRFYINTIHQKPSNGADVIRHPSGIYEIFLSRKRGTISPLATKLLSGVSLVYIHTTHLGKDFLGSMIDAPFIIDFHGIAPEEEFTQGNFSMAQELEIIEEQLFRKALKVVYVSPGMKHHFDSKYFAHSSVQLPIVSDVLLEPSMFEDAIKERQENSLVYAGGAQKWQNIEQMMELMEMLDVPFTIASDSPEDFNRWKNYKQLTVGTYNRSALTQLYLNSKFGFVLRDDSPVNRVAFPTKLFEYLEHGVVPIVDYPDLGGLSALGYRSISCHELEDLKFSEEMIKEFRVVNKSVSKKVISEFVSNASSLRDDVILSLLKS